MVDRRIRIAKDKSKLVKCLKASDDTTGPFQTYADVIVFAAALGAKRQKRVPLVDITKDLDPIRREYFDNNKYKYIVNLIAISEIKEQNVLSDDEKSNEQRIRIFEEYANGGLEILQNELRGAVDYTERIILILSSERMKQEEREEDFDLDIFTS